MGNVIQHKRTVKIQASPEFANKHLANYALNVGLLCGHGCKYCSTPALLRTHNIFQEINVSSFQAMEQGIAIVDPWTPKRITKSAYKLKSTDTVMLSTITDAWSPEAQQYNLGRKCLEVLLAHSNCKVRILTKNAAVRNDYDLISKFHDRVELSLSLTAPVKNENIAKIVEPNASLISERLSALRDAHNMSIPVYGMICPVIPGLINNNDDFNQLLDSILELNPTTIWCEPVNRRGDNIINCINALYAANEINAGNALSNIRNGKNYDNYVTNIINMATYETNKRNSLNKLKILVYSDGSDFIGDDSAVIWLK